MDLVGIEYDYSLVVCAKDIHSANTQAKAAQLGRGETDDLMILLRADIQ